MCEARFRDGGSLLYSWAEPEVLVACPRCGKPATVRRAEATGARLSCAHCALSKETAGDTSSWGEPFDPWFGLPLWLQVEFRRHTVWAYNEGHLTALRAFVAADLRERTPIEGAAMSMLEKLPGWMTSAKNRTDVLLALDKLARKA